MPTSARPWWFISGNKPALRFKYGSGAPVCTTAKEIRIYSRKLILADVDEKEMERNPQFPGQAGRRRTANGSSPCPGNC